MKTFNVLGHGDVKLVGELHGSPEAEVAVVLIHGYPDDRALWRPLAERLARQALVLSYDVRGAGESDRPEKTCAYRLDALMGDLAAVLTQIPEGKPVHLVGHDWGAIQGWEAVRRPELASRFASFTALSAPSFDDGALWARAKMREGREGWLALFKQLQRSWYVATFQIPVVSELIWKQLAKGWKARLRKQEGIDDADFPSENLLADAKAGMKLYRANGKYLLKPRKREVLVPTQVVIGERDPFVGSALFEEIASLARVETIPKAGHWLPRSHAPMLEAVLSQALRGELSASPKEAAGKEAAGE